MTLDFERLMAKNGNTERLREAFFHALMQSEWKEQVCFCMRPEK